MRKVFVAGLVMGFLHAAFGQTQLAVNGGFEAITPAPWQLSGAGLQVINSSADAHAGNNFLALATVSNPNQAGFQTITIPGNAIGVGLSYFWNVSSLNTSGTVELTAQIRSTNHTVLTNLDSQLNIAGTTTAYQQQIFNLNPFIGQTIEICFRSQAAQGFGASTTFRVDDISVLYITTNDLPRNDHFTNRFTLTGSVTNTTATNGFASKEPGEPDHANREGGRSLWWTWTAPTNGVASITTSGSTFDTLLAVYTGTSVSNLTLIDQNNNQDTLIFTSKVRFPVSAGTAYQIAVDGNNGNSGIIVLGLSFVPDTKAPTVSISSPAAGAKVTNSTIVVQGTATDAVGIDRVEFRMENAAGTNSFQDADGTNTWSATLTDLIPGTNTIRVRAFDSSGNVSTTIARSFKYVIVSPLTLTTNGSGTVTPNLNGQLLEIGTGFTVTAKPNVGSIFAGWTGDLTAATAALNFIMQSNLVLQANFIPNPFGPVAGVYQGLFYDTNTVAHESSGLFTATVTSSGTFSAKLIIGGVAASASGQFSATGSASVSIVRKNLTPVSAQLQLDLGGGGLTGQLSDGVWTAELNANRTANPATQAGRYTLVLPGSDDAATKPGGDSYGTVVITSVGAVTFSGVLADGTKVTQKAFLGTNGQWPFYVPLYSGKGSILGWLTVSNEVDRDISGTVDWFKLAQPTAKFYPAGFTHETEAMGSSYQFTAGVPVLNVATGQVSFANGNLQSFTNQVTLGTDSKVTNQSSNALTLTITTSTGLFKGTAVVPATGKSTAFTGAVLQKQNFGSGFFLGTNQTGRVFLGP